MNKKFLFAVIATTVMGNAWADDGRILTTQTYVDNELSGKVDIAQGTGDNDENVGKTLVVNQQGNLELGTVSADNFVEDSITDGVTNKAPSENAVHDALADKQNTIATGMVDLNDDWELPAITTYDTTGGLVANKIGILDQETIADNEGSLVSYSYRFGGYGAEMDNYVPTVRAVAEGLTDILNNRLNWSSSLQTPINNYSTSFINGSEYYVPTVETFANGLALKQNKIPASETTIYNIMTNQNQAAPSVVTNTATPGVVGQMAILTGSVYNSAAVDDGFGMDDFGNGTGDDMLVTARAVMNYVGKKQNKMTGTRWLDTPGHPEHNDDNCLLWDLGN